MDNKKNGIPKLRFPGFTGAWEQRKLGETSKITAGGDVNKEKLLTHGKFPVIANALTNNGIVGYYNDYYRIAAPAVTVTGRGEIGKAKSRKINFTPVVRLLAVESKHNVDFLAEAINRSKVVFESTGVPQLTVPKLSNYKISFPNSVDEETKIGDFLQQFDTLIALHQRKLEHLQEQKKGLLQKMFPKNGETVPEVRFPGFTDAWEQRKLEEVAKKITKGTTPHDKSWSGPVNYVKTESIDSNNGNISVIANTSLEEHEGYLKRSQLKENDVLFSIVGTLGRVGVVKKKDLPANTNQQICIIRPFEENSFFLLNALKTNRVKSFIKSDATIGAQPSLSLWQIEGLRIPFPNLEEQQKISAFFVKLDSLIALHQRKVDHLELMKKGLLQQMFV